MTDDLAGIRAVLFDLDGTLIDSAPDLCASLNIVLGRHGLGPLKLEAVVRMIGDGIPKLVERGFAACGRPVIEDALHDASSEMVETYSQHLTDLTVLLPGAREAVEALDASGFRLGLVTNKQQRETAAILDYFGLLGSFGAVIGGDAGYAKKPAPDMLAAALSRLGSTAAEAVMIGDSPADLRSARAAGVRIVLVRGGYTAIPVEELGADAVADGLDSIASMLTGETVWS